MKNMKIQMLAALLLAGAAFTACSNDDNAIEADSQSANATGKYILTVSATKGGDATQTRALQEGTSRINALWTENDRVEVYDADEHLLGTLTATFVASDRKLCKFTGPITFVTEPVVNTTTLTLKYNKPYYGNQDGTLTGSETSIDKTCDYAVAEVTVTGVSGTTVTTGNAAFENQQAIVNFSLWKNNAEKINVKALKIADGTNYYNVTLATPQTDNIYVAMKAIDSKPVTVIAYDNDGNFYKYTKANVTLESGKYYYTSSWMMTAVAAHDADDYVDLGLTSGTKWAKRNVGATNETDYGTYFAWGEVMGYTSDTDYDKTAFTEGDYFWGNGSLSTLTKYCSNSEYGYHGFTDTKTTLDVMDDAAAANWGGAWRMPTKAQIEELTNTFNTGDVTEEKKWKWEWQTDYNSSGHAGWLITYYSNAQATTPSTSLFLPAAGWRSLWSLRYRGSIGWYWSAALNEDYPDGAWGLFFNSNYAYVNGRGRFYGQSVRAVK